MNPTPDDLSHRLDQATPAPDPDQVEAVLRQVHRRAERSSRPRRAWVVAGAAAAALVVVVALVGLAGRGDDGIDGVRAGPGTSSGPASSDGEVTQATDADGWPEGWRSATIPPAPPPASNEDVEQARVERAKAIIRRVFEGDDGTGTALGDTGLVRGYSSLDPGQQPDGGRLEIRLRADGWPLAQDLDRALGPELRTRTADITVGGRLFPTGVTTDGPFGSPECPATLQEAPQFDTGAAPVLEASVELDNTEVPSGADVTGRVIVTASRREVTYTTGPTQVGLVVDRGTDDVVGVWTGVMAANAVGVEVGPEPTALDLIAGTQRCSPDGPPGLAPGDYEVIWGVAPCVLSDPACRVASDVSSGSLVVLARAPLTVTAWER